MTAVNAQNIILPTGTMKLGPLEYNVEMNGTPQTIAELNDLPVKTDEWFDAVYARRGAHPRWIRPADQHRAPGWQSRRADVDLQERQGIDTADRRPESRASCSKRRSRLPPELKISSLFDQSLFVRASIYGVIREALIAAALTACMILHLSGRLAADDRHLRFRFRCRFLFRSFCWARSGETINIMTLGGLALAVGILVDDATVEIENIERNLAMGKEMRQAILDGAQQIAVPAFVSTLSICIVFVPMFFLTGVAKFLFVPLAEAVSFAMLAQLSAVANPDSHAGDVHHARPRTPGGSAQVVSRDASSVDSNANSKTSGAATSLCWRPLCNIADCSCSASWCSAYFRSGCSVPGAGFLSPGGCRTVATARAGTPGIARGGDGATLRRDREIAARSRFLKGNCRRFSTTSGCRTRASTSRTVRTARSEPAMPRF